LEGFEKMFLYVTAAMLSPKRRNIENVKQISTDDFLLSSQMKKMLKIKYLQ